MRVIHNASLIILIIDILKKAPITEAVILCNGVQIPYLKKDSGYFIFCNLCEGEYKIEIFSPGFVKKELNCTLSLGECKRLIFEMSFKSNNYRISNLPRVEFLLKGGGKVLPNENIKVIMKNRVNFLKLINDAGKDNVEILLNVENLQCFLFQNYIYEFFDKGESTDEKGDKEKIDEKGDDSKSKPEKTDEDKRKDLIKKSEELFFLGYDIEYHSYILLNPLKKNLKTGGDFFPFWNLSSDDKGKVILPMFPKFMDKSFFEIEIKTNRTSKIIKIDTSKLNKNNAILRTLNLKK